MGLVRANGFCRMTRNTHVGSNVHFNGMEIRGEGVVRIGDNFHSGRGCLFITSFHDYDRGDAIPYGRSYVHKAIIIEDNVWLGDRVIVLGGSVIREGAIIQAGSVVIGEVPKCAIVGGHPATPFKWRDMEHYERLKAQGHFH